MDCPAPTVTAPRTKLGGTFWVSFVILGKSIFVPFFCFVFSLGFWFCAAFDSGVLFASVMIN